MKAKVTIDFACGGRDDVANVIAIINATVPYAVDNVEVFGEVVEDSIQSERPMKFEDNLAETLWSLFVNHVFHPERSSHETIEGNCWHGTFSYMNGDDDQPRRWPTDHAILSVTPHGECFVDFYDKREDMMDIYNSYLNDHEEEARR